MVSKESNLCGVSLGWLLALAYLSSTYLSFIPFTVAFITTNKHRNDISSRYHNKLRPWRKDESSKFIGRLSYLSSSRSLDEPEAITIKVDSQSQSIPDETSSSSPSLLLTLYEKIMEKAGTVDESRYTFPAISSDGDSRLFSNLSYKKIEKDGQVISTATHESGSMLASIALITGTTIGAGALAMPSATVEAGFLPSTAALLVSWCYMTLSGLLIAELVINRIAQTGRTGVGLLDLFRANLPGPLGTVGSVAYFFLHYAVMVAYIFGGGANLGIVLDSFGLQSLSSIPGFDQLIYTLIVGLFVYSAKPSLAQGVNNLLVLGTIASFALIMGLAWDNADFHALIAPQNQHPEMVVNAFPILFLAMVYQNVVPEVVTRLECDRKKIITSIIAGTSIPALLYIGWNGIILGNVMSLPEVLNGNLDPIALLQSEGHAGPVLSSAVSIFSELAITTSLIGFIYGVINGFSDLMIHRSDKSISPEENEAPREMNASPSNKFDNYKPAFFAAALIPPLALSISDPDIFFTALEYGGAFGVSTLFLVLPPLMIWKVRYGEEQQPLAAKPMVPFGKIPLASMWKAAGTLIIEQGAEKLGIIDFLKNWII